MRLRVNVAANTAAQVAGKFISAGANFVITILLARELGVSDYGELTKILTFTSIFYLITDFGLNAIAVKQLGTAELKQGFEENESSVFETLNTLFATRIILGLILTYIVIVLTVFLPYSPGTGEGFSRAVKLGIIVFAPTILLQSLIRSANAYFQHKLRYDKAAVAIFAGSSISLLFIGGLIYLDVDSLLVYVIALLASISAHTIASLILLKRRTKLSLVPFRLHIGRILSLLKKSAPLGLTLVLNIAFFRLDILLLSVYRSSSEVGLYGLAYKFFEFPLAVPTFFMNAMYPIMSRIKNKESQNSTTLSERTLSGSNQWSSVVKKSAMFLGISSVILTVVFWVLAPYIELIKEDFTGSIELFRLLVLWLPLFFFSSLLMWTVIAREKRYWGLVLIYGAGLVFNAGANLLLIPSYGATAAALTTGATELLVLLLLLLQLRTFKALT